MTGMPITHRRFQAHSSWSFLQELPRRCSRTDAPMGCVGTQPIVRPARTEICASSRGVVIAAAHVVPAIIPGVIIVIGLVVCFIVRIVAGRAAAA